MDMTSITKIDKINLAVTEYLIYGLPILYAVVTLPFYNLRCMFKRVQYSNWPYKISQESCR